MPPRIAQLMLSLFLSSVGLTALLACTSPAVPTPPGPAQETEGQYPGYNAPMDGVDGEARVSFQREVVPILKLHCAGCHTAGGPGAVAVEMFTATGEVQRHQVRTKVGSMLLEIQTGRMPAGKPYTVPDAQFRLLDVWAASGAPDN